MIKLYGITPSNYYSCVKTALIEKDLPFEEVLQPPGQEAELLQCSPLGKVPYIETENGYLSETNVIYDFLEELKPEPDLYPDDLFEKARTRELTRIVELYLDTPARRHLGKCVFGEPLNQTAFDEVRPLVEKGLNAFTNRAKLAPYAMGEKFTFADIASFFHIGFANFHMMDIYDWDITQSHPEIGKYMDFIGKRASIASVRTTMESSLRELIKSLQ